jgi:hypothetical protein
LFVYCLSLGKAFVVFIGQGDGADLGAFATAGAFCQIHKTGLLQDAGGKIARIAFKIQKFRVGKQFDVQMPADLDQFGGDDSHGTVIGGERLVELGHESTDGRRFFDQIDIIT